MPTNLNCSTCSAPLDVTHVSGATISCPYCGNTTILPEELRGAMSNQASIPTQGAFAPMVDRALKLAQVVRLLRTGKKIEAIKLYREIHGCGLQEAKEAVERMEAGGPAVFAEEIGLQPTMQVFPQPFQAPQLPAQPIKKAKKAGCLILLIPVLFVAGISYIIHHAISTAINATHPPTTSKTGSKSSTDFAADALEFGSEGISAGQFKDARSVAVDGNGRIYVGEYQGGRVQVFDAQGKFITQWMVDAKTPLRNLAADRRGKVYAVQSGKITSYDGANGTAQGEMGKPAAGQYEFYADVCVALDGSLYAIGQNSNIVHIGSDGAIKNTIKVADKVGEKVDFDKLAVDGSGILYALDDHQDSVFKFSPDGKYINRFGSHGNEPGQFSSAFNIAVDGKGRIYVSDAGRGIDVFDGNGRYLNSFGNGEVIFGIAINDRNEIFAAERNRHKIVKFVLSK